MRDTTNTYRIDSSSCSRSMKWCLWEKNQSEQEQQCGVLHTLHTKQCVCVFKRSAKHESDIVFINNRFFNSSKQIQAKVKHIFKRAVSWELATRQKRVRPELRSTSRHQISRDLQDRTVSNIVGLKQLATSK